MVWPEAHIFGEILALVCLAVACLSPQDYWRYELSDAEKIFHGHPGMALTVKDPMEKGTTSSGRPNQFVAIFFKSILNIGKHASNL